MIVMVANNTGIRTGYLAGRFPGKVGHLHSPRAGRNPPGPYSFLPYALDNGAFKDGENWSESEWIRLLETVKLWPQKPLWTLVPDVVGDRLRTLRRWDMYAPIAASYGWPLAFAVQDGMYEGDVPESADVVFVGGSTEFKWRTVASWCRSFQRVHVGRVNTYRRLWECHDAGAESTDGTGWNRDVGGKQQRGLDVYLEESTGISERNVQMELIA